MKRIIYAAVSLAVASTMLFSLASCSSSTDAEEVEKYSTEEAVREGSATELSMSSEEVLSYFNKLLNGVKSDMPAISYRIEKSVPNDSIKITEKGKEEEDVPDSFKALNDSAEGVKDLILKDIKKTSGDIEYGASNSDIMFVKGEDWASKLTSSDIAGAVIKEIGDKYYISITFNDLTSEEAQEVLTKAFDLRDKDDIMASEEFAKVKSYLQFNGYDVTYSGCSITAVVDRLTDQLINVSYYKGANVTADMTGLSTLEKYGNISVMFKLEDKANFDFSWESSLPTSPLETSTAAAD